MQKTAIYQRKRPGASPWFNKWIQSPKWFLGFGVMVLVCVAVYLVNLQWGTVHPGSLWGQGYGIAALVLVLAAVAYAIRRRTMRLRPGRTWYYLQVHVYGGTLFLLLMFMHTGFSLPHGVLTWWLWIFSLWVVLSGLLGMLLQKWIPTLLNAGLSVEVNYDRIPDLIPALKKKAEKTVATGDVRLRDFYEEYLSDAFEAPEFRVSYFFDITGGIQARTRQFDFLRTFLSDEEQRELDALHDLYKTKLEIDAHYTLQKALRWWLHLHVPVSIVLLLLIGLHVFSVYYY